MEIPFLFLFLFINRQSTDLSLNSKLCLLMVTNFPLHILNNQSSIKNIYLYRKSIYHLLSIYTQEQSVSNFETNTNDFINGSTHDM